MTFYAPFCLPFIIGAAVMFAVLAWKWGTWLYRLPRADKKRILFGLPTRRTFGAAWEVVSESLLHRRIFRVNPLLGYMHMSLAFGWFLLIAVGWAEISPACVSMMGRAVMLPPPAASLRRAARSSRRECR